MKILFSTLLLLTAQCIFSQTTNKIKNLSDINTSKELQLPFVGTRYFITDKGTTGRGTPHYFMRIEKNRDVYFGFEQTNQASGEEIYEEVFCGKFQTYMSVVFKKWGYDKRFYKIIGNKIYNVDSNKKTIKSNSCCSNFYDDYPLNKECECYGELIDYND